MIYSNSQTFHIDDIGIWARLNLLPIYIQTFMIASLQQNIVVFVPIQSSREPNHAGNVFSSLRYLNSWPPPKIFAFNVTPGRTYSKPALWTVNFRHQIMSINQRPTFLIFTSIKAAAASVWKINGKDSLFSWRLSHFAFTISAISSIDLNVASSWFASLQQINVWR